MSIAEQVEMQKLAERVAELERSLKASLDVMAPRVEALEGFVAQVLKPAERTLHLKDKKRG